MPLALRTYQKCRLENSIRQAGRTAVCKALKIRRVVSPISCPPIITCCIQVPMMGIYANIPVQMVIAL